MLILDRFIAVKFMNFWRVYGFNLFYTSLLYSREAGHKHALNIFMLIYYSRVLLKKSLADEGFSGMC